MPAYEKRRFLIRGKTTPELSTKYFETVCTGAVLEDGSPIRLYPIPFRYLEEGRYKKYQWLTARIAKCTYDSRPESYRVNCDSIEPGDCVPTDKREWQERQQIVFQDSAWQFDSVDDLTNAQARTRRSLGVVAPKKILSVDLFPQSDEEESSFEHKKERLRKKWEADSEGLLFEEMSPDELKNLELVKNRIYVKWLCGSGKVHNMQIMDWEVVEQQRRLGDEVALENVRKHLDLDEYAIRFFLGNIKAHPTRFTIVGLWYPKRCRELQGVLF